MQHRDPVGETRTPPPWPCSTRRTVILDTPARKPHEVSTAWAVSSTEKSSRRLVEAGADAAAAPSPWRLRAGVDRRAKAIQPDGRRWCRGRAARAPRRPAIGLHSEDPRAAGGRACRLLRACAASRAFSRADIFGETARDLKVREMPSRQIGGSASRRSGWPAKRISPAVSLTVPVMTLNSVVLPAPLDR